MTEIGRMYQDETEQAVRQQKARAARQLMIDGYSDRKLAVMMKRHTISDIWEIRDVLGSAGRPCGNHGAAEERIRTLGKKYSAADLHVIRVEARNEGRSDIICSLVADGDLVPEKGAMTVSKFLLANTNDYGPPLYIQFVVQGSNGHVLWDGNARDDGCPEDVKAMVVTSWRLMQDHQDADTILVWIKARREHGEEGGKRMIVSPEQYAAADRAAIRSEAWKEGWMEGRIEEVCSFIADGDLSLEKGAKKLGVSVDQMQKMLDALAEGKELGKDVDVHLTLPPATKGVDKYYDPIYQESFQKAYFESQVRNLKIIMAGLGVSAGQAMDLLKVPEEERARYKAAIEDAKK